MKQFETLYNTTIGTEREKQWSIQVLDNKDGTYTVRSTHGIVGGKQVEHDTIIKEGKNIGKKNETTAKEQAVLEAEREWTKKVKQGYHKKVDINTIDVPGSTMNEDLSNMNLDKVLLKPMLALEFDPSNTMKFPVFIQPKLDGVRCLVYSSGDKIIFQSRQNTLFDPFEHLLDEIKKLLELLGNPTQFVLDGELYIHGAEFNEITSMVRRSKKKHPNITNLKYHIYDCFYFGDQNLDKNKMSYAERNKFLNSGFSKSKFDQLICVDTKVANTIDDLEKYHTYYTNQSYEGIMIRTMGGVYKQQGRSKDLQKYKKFHDDEFIVTGYHEGSGAHAGTPIFECFSKVNPGKTFGVTMQGTIESKKEMLKNIDKYIGKQLTVKYQELSVDGIPRFPVGIAFRDYE